jgi:nitrogen fixation/metabolism regulation signal transduction histidine kinase
MPHGNTTQKDEVIEFNSYTSLPGILYKYSTMKPALAKTTENNALEDLGRATLQIVHDLKNQLNGLKLYATFLRKRLERDKRSPEEGETLAKLIAGLDRAARDMTALVRYARPIELRRQPHTDLRKLVVDAAREASSTILSNRSLPAPIKVEIESSSLPGEFDRGALSEALKAITEQAVGSSSAAEASHLSLHLRRVDTTKSPEVLVEWQGVKLDTREPRAHSLYGKANIHAALAGKIIEAHGGRIEYAPNTIRAWLPLSE